VGHQKRQEADGLHVLLSRVRGTLDDAGIASILRQALVERSITTGNKRLIRQSTCHAASPSGR
jgi:hypothetical protein